MVLFNNLKTLKLISSKYYSVTKYINLLYIILTTADFIQCTIYTVLSGPLGVAQPNNTALLLGTDARVNILQGGGPFPVISGTIQLPKIQIVIKFCLIYILLIT